jgi:hypothetical protein
MISDDKINEYAITLSNMHIDLARTLSDISRAVSGCETELAKAEYEEATGLLGHALTLCLIVLGTHNCKYKRSLCGGKNRRLENMAPPDLARIARYDPLDMIPGIGRRGPVIDPMFLFDTIFCIMRFADYLKLNLEEDLDARMSNGWHYY